MKLEKLKDLIQSCHINFMLGSGISRPFLSTLNNTEKLLTDLSHKKDLENNIYNLIKASIYSIYFLEVMWPNDDSFTFIKGSDKPEIKRGTKESFELTFKNYKSFLLSLNEILLFRYSNILNKQVNLFTTNIDLFIEKAIEETKHEFNDGFKGRINPIYDLSNFQKSYSKTSLQYDNKSEIPVFNILKVHGSLNWEFDNKKKSVIHSNLKHLIEVKNILNRLNNPPGLLNISSVTTIQDLIDEAKKILHITPEIEYEHFLDAYEKILVVNPTKEKFERTLIDEKFYELLRLYANSLEKENSLLFVLGFSFADEHIREITLRAANSNPTLQVIIFAFNEDAREDIAKELKLKENSATNNNILILTAKDFLETNYPEEEKRKQKAKDLEYFDFKTILKEVFQPIANLVGIKSIVK